MKKTKTSQKPLQQAQSRRPELMCPIKNWASLEACKDYADAVYFGTSDLSMRARAGAVTLRSMNKFIAQCHEYKIKAYLTVNSVIYNKDLVKAEQILKKAKQAKVDAVIIWDPAVIELAKKYKIPFIISTQANVSNWQAAEYYRKQGAYRVVLARELSMKQIKEIKKKTTRHSTGQEKVEVETFIHGAMCLAISGRCILSTYLYGTSANCGACAQPCRMQWTMTNTQDGKQLTNEGKYYMSAKDLCMIEYIPELIKAGIDSFKIEGRRRDPKYIETTARVYREAIDSYYDGTYTSAKAKKWKKELETVYNRGFSTGFYFTEPGKDAIGYDKPDNIATKKKVYIGIVKHYYAKINVGLIQLKHKGLKVGDKIIFEGETTFLEQKIDSMEIDGKKLQRAKKGDEIAIKVGKRVRKNDNVFILK